MKKLMLVFCFLVGSCLGGESLGKYLIILQAGNETNEGGARALHALLYASELAEGGHDVTLIFDGAGSGWAVEFQKKDHPLHEKYVKMAKMGVVLEICDHCSEHFKVKEQLTEQQLTLLAGDYEGHPSLLRWVDQGYQLVVL